MFPYFAEAPSELVSIAGCVHIPRGVEDATLSGAMPLELYRFNICRFLVLISRLYSKDLKPRAFKQRNYHTIRKESYTSAEHVRLAQAKMLTPLSHDQIRIRQIKFSIQQCVLSIAAAHCQNCIALFPWLVRVADEASHVKQNMPLAILSCCTSCCMPLRYLVRHTL